MAWASMHFATGMAYTGATVGLGCLIFRRGWKLLPAAMTLGGFWAMAPDMPRVFRIDFPNTPLAGVLGKKSLEVWLHQHGDYFFFHHALDQQPEEYALAGLALIIALYILSTYWVIWQQARAARKALALAGASAHTQQPSVCSPPDSAQPDGQPSQLQPSADNQPQVVYRIRPEQDRRNQAS